MPPLQKPGNLSHASPITYNSRILVTVRVSAILISVFLLGCGSSPAPPERAQRDPVTERWYGETVAELAEVNRDAKALFQQGKSGAASALITRGEALSSRLLSVPKPTLAATEESSDLDELYGQMLLANRNYGWARLQFQKNVARWKHWQPHTPDTASRLRQAEAAIAECDRRMSE